MLLGASLGRRTVCTPSSPARTSQPIVAARYPNSDLVVGPVVRSGSPRPRMRRDRPDPRAARKHPRRSAWPSGPGYPACHGVGPRWATGRHGAPAAAGLGHVAPSVFRRATGGRVGHGGLIRLLVLWFQRNQPDRPLLSSDVRTAGFPRRTASDEISWATSHRVPQCASATPPVYCSAAPIHGAFA